MFKINTTFQPKTWPKYSIIWLCQIKTKFVRSNFYWFAGVSVDSIFSCSDRNLASSSSAFLFHLFLILPVPAGTGHIKNKWNRSAIEEDNKFLAEQDKIETTEPSETPTNQ